MDGRGQKQSPDLWELEKCPPLLLVASLERGDALAQPDGDLRGFATGDTGMCRYDDPQ